MSYLAVGVGAESLLKEHVEGYSKKDWGDPIGALLDFINQTGQSIENALTDPKTQQFMREVGIKVEEVRVEELEEEEKKRQKSNMLLWGGAAAVVAFLLFRKK